MTGRPPSSMRNRVGTASGRPGSSMRLGTGSARPGTRSGQGGGSTIFGSVNVADRPMTQQGLGGMKTASKGQRQVQDRTYWLGEIRSKCNELSAEIHKMEAEMVQKQEENNTYLMYEKRAEALSTELSNLQGELHDYNMMIDRINTNKDISEMVEDFNALKVQNERENSKLEKIFIEKQKAEKEMEDLDKELQRHQMITENRVQDMPREMRNRYSQLKQDGLETMAQLTKMQENLDELTSKQNYIQGEIQNDALKREACTLFEKLNELTTREEQLVEEDKNRLNPEEEQAKLVANVKLDNQEISTMDRQIKELDNRIVLMQEELSQIEGDLEDQQSESTDKFRQLQKREQTMDEFMSSYQETRQQELEEQGQMESSIVALLEHISRAIEMGQNLPSVDRLKALKEDLQFKESELQKSESTSNALLGQSSKLQDDLSKVEELENKITSEKEALLADMERMTKELEVYSNIESLKADSEKIKAELIQEQEVLAKNKLGQKDRLDDITIRYNTLVKKLEDDETHAQLVNLERKWQHLEQNNFALKEFISSRSVDCKPVKTKVLKMIADNNKILQEMYTKSSLLK